MKNLKKVSIALIVLALIVVVFADKSDAVEGTTNTIDAPDVYHDDPPPGMVYVDACVNSGWLFVSSNGESLGIARIPPDQTEVDGFWWTNEVATINVSRGDDDEVIVIVGTRYLGTFTTPGTVCLRQVMPAWL